MSRKSREARKEAEVAAQVAAGEQALAQAMGQTTETPVAPAKPAKPMPTLAEALAVAKAADAHRYRHVESVTELTVRGTPARVVIRCEDPQSRQGVSVCQGTREIATQDLFQVTCCAACADRKVRIARRERTKRRNKEARALLKAQRAA